MSNLSNIPEMRLIDDFIESNFNYPEVPMPDLRESMPLTKAWIEENQPDWDSMAKQQRIERDEC